VFGDGSSARDYTYVDDVVDGVVSALAFVRARPESYEIINLGESRAVTLDETIRVLGEEMRVEPRIERLPMQPGDVTRTWADITKARRLLGYDPKTDFRAGVRRFLRWFDEVRAGGARA
jgi:UDP-glucuronate 4-epimerase